MTYPSKEEFIKLSRRANVITIYKEIFADFLTPVSVFQKLQGEYCYLLESVEGQEKIARFSFIGINPSVILKIKGNHIELIQGSKKEKFFSESPLDEIKKIMAGFRPIKATSDDRFLGGLVGYMGYDMVRFFEDLPDKNPDKLSIEDAVFILADTLIIFDHTAHKIKIGVNVYLEERDKRGHRTHDTRHTVGKRYDEAVGKIEEIAGRLKIYTDEKRRTTDDGRRTKQKITSNFTKAEFKNIVKKAKEYIKAGDIIQVVLSQRFRTRLNSRPFDVYRALRSLNPSPYMYYLNFGDLKMIGASPELLVRCENGVVETRPIAGTRHRGKNEAEDRSLEKDLLKDVKERAEHVMLVDLGRNDIGRVCKPKSVKVTDFMFIERYSHVMHIVSNCRGELAKGKDAYDVLKACFPAGTVSGAPKIRAMEIIDELENTRRGTYAGAVGYFSFTGNMDTCITIRTILVKGRDAFIQAGAGIVADSVPEKEYQETVNKAKAMMKAIEMAEKGLET